MNRNTHSEPQGRHAALNSARPADAVRRRVLAGALAGIGGTALLAVPGAGTAEAAEYVPSNVPGSGARRAKLHVLRNAGVGMHGGPDTALGISTFTLNPNSVTCGVGSLGNAPGAVPGSDAIPTGLATTGPFAMLMYTTEITSYKVDRAAGKITASGVMRSITTAGTQLIEDMEHPFVCQGFDKRNRGADVFLLHFVTKFWSPSANPMATVSSLRKDWAMFGSALILGEINVD
jgi:hypothetical protein